MPSRFATPSDEGVATTLDNAGMMLRRWLNDGLVEKVDKGYRKKYNEIPE